MTKPDRNFDYFEYVPPSKPADVCVQQALGVLNDIKQQFPQFYKEFRSPSEVLTLSGVRAFDTYYDLGEGASREEIDGLKSLLKIHGIILIEEDFPFGNEPSPDNRYSIVHLEALHDIPNRFRHLPAPGWKSPDFTKLKYDTEFFLWWGNWERSMLVASELDETCKRWLALSPWMAHNMTFGVLLGYPGEAICSLLYQSDEDDQAGKVVRAKIAHADKYDGAQPIYDYLEGVADSPVLAAHQALWSAILDGVYKELDSDTN